jgi:hypothetical protein
MKKLEYGLHPEPLHIKRMMIARGLIKARRPVSHGPELPILVMLKSEYSQAQHIQARPWGRAGGATALGPSNLGALCGSAAWEGLVAYAPKKKLGSLPRGGPSRRKGLRATGENRSAEGLTSASTSHLPT